MRDFASQAGAELASPASGRRGLPAALGGAAALAVLVAGAWWWSGRGLAPPQYLTVPASRGSVAQAVSSSGTVNPVTTIQVGTYVSGVIRQVSCDFNTRVKAGQLCARIDPRPYQGVVEQAAAALQGARAQLAKDRAVLEQARLADGRSQHLLQRGFLSQEAADSARSVHVQAQAQLALDEAEIAQREAQWRAARINLGYTDIVSPVDGTVVSRNVTQGQTVAASFQTPTLFLIAADLAQMQVDASVSESDIGRVKAGDAAVFTVSSFPEREFRGEVRQVRQAPQAVQNVVTYDVVIAVPNADLALKPGMTAAVRIVTRRADGVLRVPVQALRYHPRAADGARPANPGAAGSAPGAAQVWVLDQGQPRRVPVTVGLDDDSAAEILAGGLREGDPVIVGEAAAAPAGGAGAPSILPSFGRRP